MGLFFFMWRLTKEWRNRYLLLMWQSISKSHETISSCAHPPNRLSIIFDDLNSQKSKMCTCYCIFHHSNRIVSFLWAFLIAQTIFIHKNKHEQLCDVAKCLCSRLKCQCFQKKFHWKWNLRFHLHLIFKCYYLSQLKFNTYIYLWNWQANISFHRFVFACKTIQFGFVWRNVRKIWL